MCSEHWLRRNRRFSAPLFWDHVTTQILSNNVGRSNAVQNWIKKLPNPTDCSGTTDESLLYGTCKLRGEWKSLRVTWKGRTTASVKPNRWKCDAWRVECGCGRRCLLRGCSGKTEEKGDQRAKRRRRYLGARPHVSASFYQSTTWQRCRSHPTALAWAPVDSFRFPKIALKGRRFDNVKAVRAAVITARFPSRGANTIPTHCTDVVQKSLIRTPIPRLLGRNRRCVRNRIYINATFEFGW